MSLRFLLGILPSGLPEENNQTTHEELDISRDAGIENYINIVLHYQNPAKLHIGMLTLSFLVGIAYSGYTAYTCWKEKNIFLGYVRNLVIALTCRTFFSLIFDGAILLGSPNDVGGGNFLLSIEHICLNLVIAFWLTLNIYLHERVQRNFNNEPTLLIYQLGVPGVAVFFAFVWIFTLQDQWPNLVWWIFVHPFTQWIVNSVNLLYLLIQLAILGNIIRMMTKITLDNDGLSLQMKCSAMMGVLVFIFWLQFGLCIGRIPLKVTESYLYFYYLIDGLECALICLVLYFFYKWVLLWSDKVTSFLLLSTRTSKSKETSQTGDRGIVTIDSMFMTRESGKWKHTTAAAAEEEGEEGSKDVVYSNVIGPERLKKTLDLYKRLNIIPTNQVTTVEGEEFYDCQLQSQSENFETRFESLKSNVSKNQVITDGKSLKVSETKQKRNAFYSSKYLILDSKESETPKYLKTHPSVSSRSGKGSFRDERTSKCSSSDLNLSMTDELVQKWLNDVKNEKREKNETAQSKINEERKPTEEKHQPELTEDQNTTPKTIFSAINSVVSNALFGSNTGEKKSIDKDIAKPLEIHKIEPEKKPETSTEKKSELDVAKFLPEETTIPQDEDLKPVLELQAYLNVPVDTRTKESECPDDSNFNAKHSKKQEKSAAETLLPRKDKTETTEPQDAKLKQVLEPQVDIKPVDIKIIETECPEDSNFKPDHPEKQEKLGVETPTHIESYHKDQMELKTCDVTKNETPKSTNELPSFESETGDEEKDKTSGESADEIKNKPELGVLDKSDGLVLKNDPSLSHIISPTSKNEESQPEKSQNQNITYSDLLEFRSQRDKSATGESSGISKKLFDFSEVLTSTIGSLINASSSFFTTKKEHPDSEKDNESVISEIERKNLENTQDEKFQKELPEKPPIILPITEPEVTETSSESEFSIERKRDSSSSAGSFSVDQYYLQLMKTKEKFYNQPNSTYQKHKKGQNIKKN